MGFLGNIGKGILGSTIDFGFDQLSGSLNSRRSWKYAQKAMDKQFDLNKKAADYTFAQNMKAWNLENEYNSPAAQMQRYMDAGLNPHLIYKQSNTAGSLSGGSFGGSSAPAVNTRPSGSFDIISNIQALQSMEESRKRVDLLESQIGLNKVKGLQTLADTALTGSKYNLSNFEYGLKKELRESLIKSAINRVKLQDWQIKTNPIREAMLRAVSGIKTREYQDYSKTGVRPNDSYLLRFGSALLRYFFPEAGFTVYN